jgi:chemotaxis signal transduction protein
MLNGNSTLRYLPIDAAGQQFGIPLNDIQAVSRIEGANVSGSLPNDPDTLGKTLPVIDLPYLLRGTRHSGRRLHTIAVGEGVLLVDAVYPIRSTPEASQLAIPDILGASRLLFHCAVMASDTLVLILNIECLLANIGMLTAEGDSHGSD